MTADGNALTGFIGGPAVTAPDRLLEFHVYHNPFAVVPIEPVLLARRGIMQCQVDFENRTWVALRPDASNGRPGSASAP